jgi:hypothetical protein
VVGSHAQAGADMPREKIRLPGGQTMPFIGAVHPSVGFESFTFNFKFASVISRRVIAFGAISKGNLNDLSIGIEENIFDLSQSFPLKQGRVVFVDENFATINISSKDGLAKGDVVDLFAPESKTNFQDFFAFVNSSIGIRKSIYEVAEDKAKIIIDSDSRDKLIAKGWIVECFVKTKPKTTEAETQKEPDK